MPLKPCKAKGKSGTRWGNRGRCYVGVSGKARAKRQMHAILASGWTENAEGCGVGEPVENKEPRRRPNPLRTDPTRTASIRRRFTRQLKRRFLRIRQAIRRALLEHNVLQLTENVFCATGEGGGIDPTCGRESSGASGSGGKISSRERGAIQDYSTDAFRRINKELREGKQLPKDTKRIVDLVDAGLRKLPRHKEMTFRKIQTTPNLIAMLQRGKTFVDPAFFSTSKDRPRFVGKGTIAIAVAGKSGRDISAISHHTTAEKEVLFPRGVRFEVVNHYTHEHGGHVAVLREIEEQTENASDCGAGEEGSPGFQEGNTCGTSSQSPKRLSTKNLETLGEVRRLLKTVLPSKVGIGGTSVFFRAGKLPPGGYSHSSQGVREKGVSVWDTPWSRSLAGMPRDDWYYGLGKVVGSGSDDEPVIEPIGEWRKLPEALNSEESFVKEFNKRDGFLRTLLETKRSEQTTNAPRFVFRTTPERLAAFVRWIQRMIEAELIDATDPYERDAYWRAYVEEGFRQGQGRAWDDVHKVMLRERVAPWYEGSREEFLRVGFGQPVAVDRVKLLAGRVFTDLQGISSWTATQMNRSLSDSMAQGESAVDAMRRLVETARLSEERALLVARTETIRAHAEGQLTAMEEMGVTELGVAVEWDTVHDDRVCSRCSALQGIVIKTSEAHGLIPYHPNCRCSFLPANVGESEKDQVRSKRGIEDAISDSVGGEKTTWAGADAVIDRDRPESGL